MDGLKRRVRAAKDDIKSKRHKEGWILAKQPMTFADESSWSNRDSDVTPLEQRTWTAWTLVGFWFSDVLSAQSWSGASAIIAVGLTWREAVYCLILGTLTLGLPLSLNGAAGAELHVPFPIVARSGFGFLFSRFAIVIRMVTALFWHAIQTYSGSTAMTQVIRAIWPSYLDIPNHLPASAGITTQQLVSHFLFWSVQFPILLTPPFKLKWFFVAKAVIVVTAATGTVIGMSHLASGTGGIWDQTATVSGSTRAWLILSSMSSMTGSWATMATNVADFTRYLKKPNTVYWQVLLVPAMSTLLGVFGIIGTSCAKVVYGQYIWDPLALASHWDGPGGRTAAFFVGVSWVVAQIGTNLSANVISCANDMTSLFPKYVNIRRGVIITTVTAGWIMVPWKIVNSAASLLNFMGALGIFLAPIAAILGCDYWLVKRKAIDVPALYRRHGRYNYGTAWGSNWRAAVALVVGFVPNLPGMAAAVNPKVKIGGASYVYDIFYLYGYTSSFVLYYLLNVVFPDKGTLIPQAIHEDTIFIDGQEMVNDGLHDPSKGPTVYVSSDDAKV
ncbi:NCS1 allantoate transporter [Niveomyces insectorum RCEF 264]|uniref:NCS1 allantoate transporter n=1 Tax=Niveomyces insectorum RCEF 264 TaxID=1081102 RepID=A0A162MR52_9HYPO|nr:NCS1 allantoate transporter [Niveomyces insectorum RCEF 264]